MSICIKLLGMYCKVFSDCCSFDMQKKLHLIKMFMMDTLVHTQAIPGFVLFTTEITIKSHNSDMRLYMVPDVGSVVAGSATDHAAKISGIRSGDQGVNLCIQAGVSICKQGTIKSISYVQHFY